MGRNSLPDAKVQIASRVVPRIKAAIDAEAASMAGRPTVSQTIEILLEESPRVKARLRQMKKEHSNGRR